MSKHSKSDCFSLDLISRRQGS